jgi:predicted RNA binding protein YcfA (HicA-like mRNA interferase family)
LGRRRKLLDRILSGGSDTNVPFDQTRALLRNLGFSESVRGSHHKFVREGVEELINLQETGGGKCKPYQVKQVRGCC